MKLKLNVAAMRDTLHRSAAFRTVGKLHSVRDILTARLPATVGEQCDIHLPGGDSVPAEVVGVDGNYAQLMCFRHVQGLRAGMDVVAQGRSHRVPLGESLLGRTLDGLGLPIDGRGPLMARSWAKPADRAPDALQRSRITQPLVTGQRVIDGMLTLGRGQRVGLFAGSGVGKSTLMGEIAKIAHADVNVVALVGERGREIRPFVEDCLGEEGLRRSVVVAATSDETPLMRIQAVRTAITIAEGFRRQGGNVLFFLDSITRLAFAQRELGLSRGEPPGARGYPGSVQTILAQTLERLGTDGAGSITGIITVLVDGDDLDEPIADAARSILDGHIVLDRKLASRGHYPAVDVLGSVSRLFTEITTPEHQKWVGKVRRILATYREVEDLVRIGAYQKGTSPEIDKALQLMPAVEFFLRQGTGESCSFQEMQKGLKAIADAWTF